MKKLLIYVNSMNALGGIERVIANLSEKFAEYYNVTILVKDDPVSSYYLPNSIEMETLDVKLKLNMNLRAQRILHIPLNMIKSIFALKRYLKERRFDYIYVAFPTNGLEIYLANKYIRKRIIATEHASFYAYNSIYKKIKQWLYPRLEAISVPTTMDTKIYQTFGYKAFYIPHLSTYNELVKNSMSSKRIINVGRLTSDKQQLMLLRIWKKVNEDLPNNEWRLQIIGSGEEKQHLEEYVRENKLKNVELIPHTKNIKEYYRNAELFVFTSKMEGFGMVLLEAMSFGVPCISFDCPSGPRDIIHDNQNGYLVPCYDENAFVKKILYYINLPTEQKRVLSKGALDTIKNWNNEKIIDQWRNLFDKLEK